MDCRRFELCFADLLAGNLGRDEREACIEHAAVCGPCGELLELAEMGDQQGQAAEPELLVRGVLEQTSGQPCARVRQLLPAAVDGELEQGDQFLVERHARGCEECAATLGALREMQRVLPTLRDLQPDRRFVADVMRATVPWPIRLRRRVSRAVGSWLHRPRCAAEAAFTVVVVCLLLVQATGIPLAALPGQAAELLEAPKLGFGIEIDAVVAVAVDGVRRVAQWVGHHLIEPVVALVQRAWEFWSDGLQEAWTSFSNTLRTTWESVASLLTNAETDSSGAGAADRGQNGGE